MVLVYTTHCPQCKMLEKYLKDNKIKFQEITDIDVIQKKGIYSVPKVELEDGTLLNASQVMQKIKEKGDLN